MHAVDTTGTCTTGLWRGLQVVRTSDRSVSINPGSAIDEQGRDIVLDQGDVVGIPHYMSPEQIIRPRSIDHRSDVYSVGCVFYEVLTGRPPFVAHAGNEGDTDFAIKQAHVNTKPVSPKERVADIPEGLDRLIMLALEKDPEKRLPGCQEFL